jgi:6-phosphogluconolactonase (cycloisomerase 2 family)
MKVSASVKLALVGTVCLLSLAGCGGGGSSGQPVTVLPSGVTVSPSIATVPPSGVQKFGATVTPSGTNLAVTWSVSCSIGENCGTIDASGNYTAPATLPSPDTITVIAKSVVNAADGIATVGIVSGKIELGPVSVAVAPDPSGKFGKFAYVANSGSDNVSMYAIDATTGNLETIGTIAAGITPNSVAVDPSGKFVYVANRDSSNISMYTIDATTGVLQSIGTIGAGTGPDSVVVHPSGKFVYVANTQGYWDYGSTNVSMYRINATTGALTSIGTINEAFVDQTTVAVHPSGNFAYVASSGFISMYTVDATTGALTSIGSVTAQDTGQIAVHPSGKFAYVTNLDSSNTISMYTINQTTGALTPTGTVATGKLPEPVAIDPSGRFAYAANWTSNEVSMYSIDGATGNLISIGTIAAGSGPDAIAIDPSGKFAYVANVNSNNISMYTIDSTTGALTLIGSLSR